MEFETLVLQDTYISLLSYHKIFTAFFALPFVANLLIVFLSAENLAGMVKKMWFITPIIFFLLSVSILSGINIWIFGNIGLKLSVIAMMTFCVFVFIGEIFRFKILKVARRTNREAMLGYVRFCRILYSIDLFFFILLFAIV